MAQSISNVVKNPFGFSSTPVSPFSLGKTSTSPFQSTKSTQTTGPMSVAPKFATAPIQSTVGMVSTPIQIRSSGSSLDAGVGNQMNTGSTNPIKGLVTPTLYDPSNSLQMRPGETPEQYRARNPISNPIPAQTPTYSGLVGDISKTAGSLGTQAERINTSASKIGSYGEMTPEETQARKRLAELTGIASDVNTNIENHPSDFAFQMGREAVAGRNIDARNQALAQTIEALAAERGANIQAYTGQAGAEQGAGGLLSSAGGLQGTAAGYAQPSPAAYGQTVFNPLTGQYEGGGSNLDPQTQASSLAQKVMGGQMTYDQALSSIGYAGSAGTNFLNQAITSAGGNPLQLQASGSATQNVIGTQTTQVEGYKSALQQGQNLQAQLTDLISTFGLNPNDVNAVNTGLQKIAQNISSPQYKILSNYVNDIANTYSQVLTPPGGSATDTTRSLASSMLDATAKGTSLIATMKSLDQAAQAKIAGVSTTGSSPSSSSSSGSSAGWY